MLASIRARVNAFGDGAFGVAVVFALSIQTLAFSFQSALERTGGRLVDEARQEQARMVEEGFSPPRFVGDAAPFRHGFEALASAVGFGPENPSSGSWFATRVPVLGTFGPAASLFSLVAPAKCVVNAGDASSSSIGSDGAMLRMTLRHEDSHCQLEDFPALADISPRFVPKEAAALIAAAVKARSEGKPPDGESDWRVAYLGALYSESFADVRAVLSGARFGTLKSDAMKFHAWRSVGSGASTAPTLIVAGNDHATDAALYIAAQMDEMAVAKLDGPALDALAKAIASDALVWTALRQRPEFGLFAPSSVAEYRSLAGPGLAASAEPPKPVSGPFAYEAGGSAFVAQGSSLGSDWKFDGLAGSLLLNPKTLKVKFVPDAPSASSSAGSAPPLPPSVAAFSPGSASDAIRAALSEHRRLGELSGDASDGLSRCQRPPAADEFVALVYQVCELYRDSGTLDAVLPEVTVTAKAPRRPKPKS